MVCVYGMDLIINVSQNLLLLQCFVLALAVCNAAGEYSPKIPIAWGIQGKSEKITTALTRYHIGRFLCKSILQE